MVVICKSCYIPMINVMSFTKERHERFCKCPKCHSETKHRKLREEELDFSEILHKEIKKK